MKSETKETKNEHGGPKPKLLKVGVNFPLASKPPFKQEFPPEATVEEVRVAAMAYFQVADNETTVYYLTFGRKRPDAGTTLGDLAGKERSLKFTLAKELIQG